MTRTRLLLGSVLAIGALLAASVALATNPPAPSIVFVARGDDGADALGASSLAGRLGAPIVLVGQTSLPNAAATAIVEAEPETLYVLGGEGAISADVQDGIAAIVPDAEVVRVSGDTRYDTAAAVAALFDDLGPAFLPIDGTANDAEVAQTYGGLTADQARRSRSLRDYGVDGASNYSLTLSDTLQEVAELEIEVDAPGLLLVGGSLAISADTNGTVTTLATLDRDTSLGNTGTLVLEDAIDTSLIYDSTLVVAADTEMGTDTELVPGRWVAQGTSAIAVEPGTHILRIEMTGSPGLEILYGYIDLWATLLPGGTGTHIPFELP